MFAEKKTTYLIVLDNKNDIRLANKEALALLGNGIIGKNIADFILVDEKIPEQSFFDKYFEKESVLFLTPSGYKVCDTFLSSKIDKFSDILSKVVVISDMTAIDNHNTLLLQSVNQLAAYLLDTDVASFNNNLFQAIKLLGETAEVDRVYIWKNHVVNGELYCTQLYEWSENAQPQQGNELTIDIPYSEIAVDLEETLSSGNSINSIVRDMAPELREHLSQQGILSILVVPIFIHEHFWGFAGFDDCHNERLFTDEEEAILRSVSLLFANALIRHEMEYEIDEASKLTKVMLDSSPLSSVLWDKNMKIVECNEASVKLYELKSKQEYINRYSECSPEYQPDGQRSAEKSKRLLNIAFEEGHCTTDWVHKIPNSDTLIPAEVTLVRISHKNDYFVVKYTRDLRDIINMGNKVAHLEKEVEKIYFDALTGIYNRRFFDENLNRVMRSLSRSCGTLSLIMIDIDYFKNYNDTYGHGEGDKCLKSVAEILTKSVSRSEDFVVRYGGEEFAVVLPNTNENGACVLADKLLNNIRNYNIPHKSSDIADHITISIGIATGVPFHGQNGEDFVKRADEMLYASKKSGRNRYTFVNYI
jgi:diguanylate cyclase (GGDEF)-like protein